MITTRKQLENDLLIKNFELERLSSEETLTMLLNKIDLELNESLRTHLIDFIKADHQFTQENSKITN